MNVTITASSIWTPVAPNTGEDPSSDAPTWAFMINNLSHVTHNAGAVIAVADQSSYGLSSLAVNGITLDNSRTLGGSPSFLTAPDRSGFIRFAERIGTDNRAELSKGLALCAVLRTEEGNIDSYTANQGLFGDGFTWASLQYNQRFLVLESQGGQQTGFNNDVPQWSFRYAVLRPNDHLSVGSSRANQDHRALRRGITLPDANIARYNSQCGLLLCNRYTNINTPDTKGALMNLAAFAIVPPDQVGRCRRYWSNLYATNF
jgi:hypothetical protein